MAQWEAALERVTPTILHVTGPGGIGKSALVRVFVERAQAVGLRVKEIDARTVEPSIPAVRAAFDAAGFVPSGDRVVVVLDTYELLASCDFFVRAEVLRRAGPHLVVIAGRGQPDPGWLANNGWGVRVASLALENLHDHDTRRYLELRGLVGERSEAIRAFCQGHPLALALAAETALQPTTQSLRPGDNPDVVGALLEQFLREIPDDAFRTTLEICALTRHLREDLLADFVGAEPAARAFPWLRRLSFVERSRLGVRLHDVARAVILRDLRWRNPPRFEALFARARHVLADRASRADVGDPMQKVEDIHFLMRLGPELRDHVEASVATSFALDVARAEDAPILEEILRLHEGEASVATLRRWFPIQRERFVVVRSPADPVLGFAATLTLDARADTEPDARIRAVACHARRLVGSSPGAVLYTPFWMTRDGYHRLDEVRLALGAAMARWLLDPDPVALAYVHTTSAEATIGGLERTGARLVRELGFAQGGVDQAVFVYDRRGLTPLEWYVRCLRAMDAPVARPSAAVTEARAPLDRAGFDAAVRAALRALHDVSRLKESPLLSARIVGDAPPGRAARATRLRAVLVERVERLRDAPRRERQYLALHAAFVDAADNQERAAERCRMAYSTFRRHLASGIARVVEELWSAEMGEMP
ncbi:Hypothetical protein A7982_06438 [Minicystis rosea]|nr:Hypothetical protein A7982_06438 [Minicystis rosea]